MSYRPPKKPTLALETDIVQDNIPAEVYPNIYIGSIHAAFNQEALLNLGITHILNASRLPSTFPKSFTYLSIDIRDKDEANILACIPAANIFIEAGIESGGVMVHCYGGRSRSAALVAAFLMSSFEWSYAKSLQTIQAARPVAHINHGFETQLKAYVHAKYDVYIAQQVLLQGRVHALQCYRAIEGNTDDELLIKANERKKFGSLHPVGSNGHTKSRRNCSHNSQNNRPGNKRSWGNAKDEDDVDEQNDSGSSSEDAEEEDNLMESAVKSYHTTHPLDIPKECSYSSTSTTTTSSFGLQKSTKTPFSAISSSSSSLLLLSPPSSHSHSPPPNYLTSPRTQINTFHHNGSMTAHILASHDPNSSHHNTPQHQSIEQNSTSPPSTTSSNSTSSTTKLRQHIPLMDPRSPRLRLSRPGSTSVRVIPPLRGLERVFCCAWCHCQLFNLASVIRTDIRVDPLPNFANLCAAEKEESSNSNHRSSFSSSSTGSSNLFLPQATPRGSAKLVAPSSQEKESTYLMPAPSPRGSNFSFNNLPFPDDAKLSSTTYSSPDKLNSGRQNMFGSNSSSNNNNHHHNTHSSSGGMGVQGYKSPPKTSRSRSSKAFDFDILNDETATTSTSSTSPTTSSASFKLTPHEDETNTLKLVSDNPNFHDNNHYHHHNNHINNNSNNHSNNNHTMNTENRVNSPMEISDEKQSSCSSSQIESHHVDSYSKEVDEKPYSVDSNPSSLSRKSSKNQFRVQVGADDQHHHHHQQGGSNSVNSSRPGSSYRQRDNTNSTPLQLSRNLSSTSQQIQPPPLSPTESPRIQFPHEPRESFAYPSPRNRPQSAEKRRWLERVNLLKSDMSMKQVKSEYSSSSTSSSSSSSAFVSDMIYGKHDEKVTKLSQDDDEAIKLGFGSEKYIYLEYLEWMGEELLSSSINSGELKCSHCSHTIGSWSWTPTYKQTLNGILQVPVIKVHKNVVHETDVPLDPTPLSTPRVDDQMEEGNSTL